MPLSDEDRLENVYGRVASIRLRRRVQFAAMALPVLLVLGAAAFALDSPGDTELVQAGGGPGGGAGELPDDLLDQPLDGAVTTTLPPHIGTIVPPPDKRESPKPTVTTPTTEVPVVPTTTTAPPYAENCGGDYSNRDARPKPPPGMVVTTEASKQTVKRGEEVVLTLRAHWTGSEPLTYTRQGKQHLLYSHRSGEIFYSNQYDTSQPQTGPGGQDTFQPGEEKSYSVQWDTSKACNPYGGAMTEANLRTGTYTVEGIWDSSDSNWYAEPATFELTE